MKWVALIRRAFSVFFKRILSMDRHCFGIRPAAVVTVLVFLGCLPCSVASSAVKHSGGHSGHGSHRQVEFSIRSLQSGAWSNPQTWNLKRVPKDGDRVLVTAGTRVEYDVQEPQVIRLLQVAGTLRFSREKDTLLNVGILKVQESDQCSEDGFACDFDAGETDGELQAVPDGSVATLDVGLPHDPIPAGRTARIRLHYLEGFNRDDAPAIACCSARMELHGSPLPRTWVKLGTDAKAKDQSVTLNADVAGWSVGDSIIVTATDWQGGGSSFRAGARSHRTPQTEERRISAIDGRTLTLDQPLKFNHAGSGEFRGEVALLTRNVVIESADPAGVRGHTVYHRSSSGGISYAQFAHLGKEGVLGRYPIHFHLVGDTMRGSSVRGVAVVDSHNRWVTIHNTNHLVVRDCVGYQSVGHGYFLEDGTEVGNLLAGNLGVQSYFGPRLKNLALPFDDNAGAAFWWANGRNTLAGNVGVENDQYAFRYDMKKSSQFDPALPLQNADGTQTVVDVRTIPIWKFEANEAHTNFAGMVVAANGDHQPDAPIEDQRMLEAIRAVDWTGPDAKHPHVIRNFTVWNAHYAFRPQSPSMLMDGLRIDRTEYGVYRPAFDNHEYRNVHLSRVGSEPFNRGMDDASAQVGRFTVDGLKLEGMRNDGQYHPLIHMTDNALGAGADAHFRNVSVVGCDPRRPVFNRGGSTRVDPFVKEGVPYFIHNHFGPGRHAKLVSTKAADLYGDGSGFRAEPPLTGDESRLAEVANIEFPRLLDPTDDLPPATLITDVRSQGENLIVSGATHDNGDVAGILVNGLPAKASMSPMPSQEQTVTGIVHWQIILPRPANGTLVAVASDAAGNVEPRGHRLSLTRAGHNSRAQGHGSGND